MMQFAERRLIASILPLVLCGTALAVPPSFPPPAFPGDPKLEPMQTAPFAVSRLEGWFNGMPVAAHLLPTPSFGDGGNTFHGDMFVLVSATSGTPVAQPPILAAIPRGAAGPSTFVPEIVARSFSPTWEMHFVRVRSGYNPNNIALRIDSVCDLLASNFVQEVIATNMYLNAPLVPAGSTVEDGTRTPIPALWEGHLVNILPYDLNDWQASISEVYVFKNTDTGDTVGNPVFPHVPGEDNFNPLVRVMNVLVDNAYVADSLKSKTAILASGRTIEYAGISLNVPIVEVDGVAVPIENAFTTALNSRGRFARTNFPIEKASIPLADNRVFKIEDIAPRPDDAVFLAIADVICNGRIIPGPPVEVGGDLQPVLEDAQGNLVHVDQMLLDDRVLGPRLPLQLQQNLETFFPDIAAGPIEGKLALVGQALFERPFRKSEGVGDVLNQVSCASCHQFGGIGGAGQAGRDVFQTPRPDGLRRNTPMLFGAGVLSRIEQDHVPDGSDQNPKAFRHKGLNTLREICADASQNELGMQAPEVIAREHGMSIQDAKSFDADNDGVVEELTTGDVTAITAFTASLPVPVELTTVDGQNLRASSVRGEALFFKDIRLGGAGCGSCHIEFLAADGPFTRIDNPETTGSILMPVPVDIDGATMEIGAILYGDMRRHKIGPLGADPIPQEGVPADVFITAELWGVGSTSPYWHDGRAGGSLEQAIALHKGLTVDARVTTTIGAASFDPVTRISTIPITVRNISGAPIPASPAEPIHVVLSKLRTNNVSVLNADGGQIGPIATTGIYWAIGDTLDPGESAVIQAQFLNPRNLRVNLLINVADHEGYSEALDEVLAFERLSRTGKTDIINFMRTLRQP